jgi:hypothetical protein
VYGSWFVLSLTVWAMVCTEFNLKAMVCTEFNLKAMVCTEFNCMGHGLY